MEILDVSYNYQLILVAFLIASLASYTCLNLFRRFKFTRGIIKLIFLIGGSLSIGLGIWSMHFVSILALNITVRITYNLTLLLISIMIPILFSFLSLFYISKNVSNRFRLMIGSIVLGWGIGAMHYTGMAAIEMDAKITYNPILVVLSIMIGCLASYFAFWFFTIKQKIELFHKLIASFLLGGAIFSVHYVSIVGTTFYFSNTANYSNSMIDQYFLGISISFASVFILGFTLTAIFIDRRLIELLTHHHSLFENNSDIVILLGKDGKIKRANSSINQITNHHSDDYKNRHFLDFIAEDDKEKSIEFFNRCMSGETIEYEIRVLKAVDLPITLLVKSTPLIIENELRGIYVIAKDITEKKKSDLSLKQSEERYRVIVENSLDAIGINDGEKWLYINRTGVSLFGGHHRDDIVGQPIYRFLHPRFHEKCKMRTKAIMSGVIQDLTEQQWYTLDGKLIETEVLAIPILFEEKKAVQIIIRDITERKENQKLMIQSEKLSVAGQLAAGIAHEIRNPLTAIKGFIQLMESDSENKVNRTYYKIIKSEMERIELILGELLVLAKPQANKYNEENIKDLLEQVTTLLTTQAILNNIEIITDYTIEDIWIHADGNQIKQVFINLIKNAIEVMPNGGKITIQLAVADREDVLIQVIDQGMGIREEKLKNLGIPFYTTKEKGTGLGLAVSYKIIEAHNGSITVSSKINVGTTFSIRLPIVRVVQKPNMTLLPTSCW